MAGAAHLPLSSTAHCPPPPPLAPALLHGLACWFDVQFRGSTQQVVLSTGPFAPGTHWYQCRLLLQMPLGVNAGQVVTGMLRLRAHDKQSHFVDLECAWRRPPPHPTLLHRQPPSLLLTRRAVGLEGTDIVSRTKMNLQDQMYHVRARRGPVAARAPAVGRDAGTLTRRRPRAQYLTSPAAQYYAQDVGVAHQ